MPDMFVLYVRGGLDTSVRESDAGKGLACPWPRWPAWCSRGPLDCNVCKQSKLRGVCVPRGMRGGRRGARESVRATDERQHGGHA